MRDFTNVALGLLLQILQALLLLLLIPVVHLIDLLLTGAVPVQVNAVGLGKPFNRFTGVGQERGLCAIEQLDLLVLGYASIWVRHSALELLNQLVDALGIAH